MPAKRDRSTLSQKPSQVRNRLRRRGVAFQEELELYQKVAYQKPIEEWDVEELARGRPRNKNGGFGGSTPKWITPLVIREAKRRLMDHTFGTMATHVDLAIKTVVKIMESEETDSWGKPIVDARTKLAAATFVLEHIVGKPKAVIEVDASDVVQQYLAASIVVEQEDGTYAPAHPVIDGQFKDNDEETEEDDDDDQ